MRLQNYDIAQNMRDYLLQPENGGTGVGTDEEALLVLNGISKDSIGKPGGILGLNHEGLVDSHYMPGSLGGANAVNLFGPMEVGFGETISIEITNYDVFTNYTVLSNLVTVTRRENFLFVHGTTPGLGGWLIVNGSRFDIVVRAPDDSFTGALRDSYRRPLVGNSYTFCPINATNAYFGFPEDSTEAPGSGKIVEANAAGIVRNLYYSNGPETVEVTFTQNASLTIQTDTETVEVTTSGTHNFSNPKFIRLIGSGGSRIDTTLYESSIGTGGGPAGPNTTSGTSLSSPDYSRIPPTLNQFTLTHGELETVITGPNSYTKKYYVDYRVTLTGVYSHRETFTAEGTFTSNPGFISPEPLRVRVGGVQTTWASERPDGSGREIRTVEYNYIRNQRFGETIAVAKAGQTRVFGSPRFDFAVENSSGTVTLTNTPAAVPRQVIKTPSTFPYAYFGNKIVINETGTNVLVAQRGSGTIRRFSFVNGAINELPVINIQGAGANTGFGVDMAADGLTDTIVVLAPSSTLFKIAVLKRNTAIDAYSLAQGINDLPDIGYTYTMGKRVEVAPDGSFFLLQAVIKISDLYNRNVLLRFDRDQTGKYVYSGDYMEDIRSWSPSFNWGHDFKISRDSTKIFVGSPGNLRSPGCVHVFLKVNGSWLYYKTLTSPNSIVGDEFGKIIETSILTPSGQDTQNMILHVSGLENTQTGKDVVIYNYR